MDAKNLRILPRIFLGVMAQRYLKFPTKLVSKPFLHKKPAHFASFGNNYSFFVLTFTLKYYFIRKIFYV